MLEDIRKIAPELFVNDIGEESIFEIECDDGWKPLIELTVQAIDKIVLNGVLRGEIPEDERELYYFTQIKEKKGSLAIYFSRADERIDKILEAAHRQSVKICEVSGESGSLHQKSGYFKTLSPREAAKLGYTPVAS